MRKTFTRTLFLIKSTNPSGFLIFKLVLFSIISYFFELLGIGIFIPIINYINEPDSDFFLNQFFNFNLQSSYIYTILGILIIFIFLGKSIFLIVQSVFHVRLWSHINVGLTKNIFEKILKMEYIQFLRKSNSSYLSLIITEIELFSELVKFAIYFVVESIILASLLFFLLFYNTIASVLVLSLILITLLIFYFIFKRRLINWGTMRQYHQDELQKNINGGLISYISINVNRTIDYFSKKIQSSIISRNSYIKKQYVYEAIPKSLIEILGIIIIIISYLFLKNFLLIDTTEIISFLIFLIITFSRALPSLNRLLTSYNFISFSKSVVDKLYEFYEKIPEKKETYSIKTFQKNISIIDLSFSYDELNFPIKNMNLNIIKGEIVGIFGDSGSGKSTLIKLILGLLRPTSGTIKVDDLSVYSNIESSLFGYVEQNVRIFDSNLYENITFKKELDEIEKKELNHILEITKLNQLTKEKSNINLIEDGSNLSGGQIQRIGLARALFKKPKILILDEFTSALDNKNRDRISSILLDINKENNLTMLIISHDIFFKSICSKIVNL